MAANALTSNTGRKVRVRGIALPNEHGSWGFLFEPLVAAVAVAPSVAAAWIVLLVVGAFLTRQPLKILLSDLLAKRNLPQTTVALKFAALYGTISCFGLAGSLVFVKLEHFIPFGLVIPFAIYQVYCDVSRRSRQLVPEILGPITISSSAAVIALASDWTLGAAIALWAIFVARFIPSIFYVRSRLKLDKGKDFSMITVIIVNFIAFGVIWIFSEYNLASRLTLAMFFVLLGRAFLGLSRYRQKMKAIKIGIWEVIYGLLVVLSIIFGHYLGI